MQKRIKFVPIYKGELNMTPKRYQGIENAMRYSERVRRHKIKRITSTLELILSILASGYLVAAMLGLLM